jgi:hypothetical protein
MAADGGPTEDLLRRLLAAISGEASVHAGATARDLLATARAEAEREIRALLTSAFKASLLRQVVDELERGRGAPAPAAVVESPLTPRPPEATAPPAGAACYVYAITPAGEPSPVLMQQGVDPAFPVEAVRVDDLQAIVSPVSLDEFGQAALGDRVADPQWVEAKVRAHDRIVKTVLSVGAVIPFRFCTVVRSAEDVRDLLARHHDRVAATLSELAGKTEWGVKVYLDLTAADGESFEAGESSGAAYLRRKSREVEARQASVRQAREGAVAFHDELAAIAMGAAVTLPLHRRDGVEIVLNGAYLIADADVARFHDAVATWRQDEMARGWSIEVTGPWPPYNFAQLDLSTEVAA